MKKRRKNNPPEVPSLSASRLHRCAPVRLNRKATGTQCPSRSQEHSVNGSCRAASPERIQLALDRTLCRAAQRDLAIIIIIKIIKSEVISHTIDGNNKTMLEEKRLTVDEVRRRVLVVEMQGVGVPLLRWRPGGRVHYSAKRRLAARAGRQKGKRKITYCELFES